jgi:acyl-CoA synthetase (AMP-forming)/AMP-acid ligase II
VDLLRWRAVNQPDRRALVFLSNGEQEEGVLTYGSLDARVRSVAAGLVARGLSGHPALLLYPSSIDFVIAFLACLYSGVFPVPAYPPRPNRTLGRLRNIAQDVRPVAVLSADAVLSRIEPLLDAAGLPGDACVATDRFGDQGAGAWSVRAIEPDSLAYVQYTSGSTATPRGVMVSHANLLANNAMIEASLGLSDESTIVTWLPLFHDMGLVGNVLQAFYLGTDCVVMPPEAFLMKPARWLRAISRYRGRCCGAPNFAFELCVAHATAERLRGVDLSLWDVAFVGAEPVRAGTLERFARALAPFGFRREALFPCYGLAEATLFVSGRDRSAPFTSRTFRASALEDGRAEPVPEGRVLVSCGRGEVGDSVLIVDPATRFPSAPGEVGEIWVTGPHVARGYWLRGDESSHTFRARLRNGDERTFLRTGDLGFVHDGDLFINGRLKDLIIIAGRNHHPVDIEQTVEQSHPAVRRGGSATFSIECDHTEALVVVAELERAYRGAENRPIEQSIRDAVAAEHDLAPHDVVLVRPASIPKTTSGKIQRHLCREHYLAGSLDISGGAS